MGQIKRELDDIEYALKVLKHKRQLLDQKIEEGKAAIR